MQKSIAIFGGGFDPPGEHHRRIALELARSGQFDEVVVIPCGFSRPDKPNLDDTKSIDRAVMADLAFAGVPKVRVDLSDLEKAEFTRTWNLDETFRHEGDVWHVVGADLVQGGKDGGSVIQREWKNGSKLWEHCNFAVILRKDFALDSRDLPPHHRLFEPEHSGSSTEIRERILRRQSIAGVVAEKVADYIERYSLYRRRKLPGEPAKLCIGAPRLLIVADERNPEALRITEALRKLAKPDDPNLIVAIGGDGTLLHAAQRYWQYRLPLFGINTGHRGFLLNDVDDQHLSEVFCGELDAYQVPLLSVEAKSSSGETRNAFAFNDAWVQVEIGKTAWLEVSVNGEVRVPKMICDGALVATPQGSTGYARGMGANPIKVGTQNLVLVGSNVLEPPTWKSAYYLDIEYRVSFRSLDPTPPPKKRPLFGFVDGLPLGEIAEMRVQASRTAAVELVYLHGHDLGKKLLDVQFPLP